MTSDPELRIFTGLRTGSDSKSYALVPRISKTLIVTEGGLFCGRALNMVDPICSSQTVRRVQ